MKPLILPKLVAERESSKSSLEMSLEPMSSVYSSTDSGFYSASECSTPPTPSFHRGHLRFPSSTSSLSSSPPTHEPIDAPNASGKLPKLAEEPVEREDELHASPFHRCLSHDMDSAQDIRIAEAYNDFADYCPGSMFKRRRSVESSAHSVTHRLERSFPSLSRKVRERKRASTFSRPSRSTTPSRAPSTRTSSITSSIHQIQSYDLTEKLPSSLASAQNSREQLPGSIASSPIDIAKANALDFDAEEVESERFATTPLLPPMMVTTRLDDVPTQSPLQSPTVAMTDPMQSLVTTPVDSPPVRAYPTPPLSTKASIASFKARSSPLVPSADIPPIMLADPNDKWALTLGHDNFTIHPEPYMPDICDAVSLKQLFANWEQARRNFTKHQVRMAEHNGPTSKIYQLCEQKWAEIDALWKKNNDLAISRATALGEEPEPSSPLEPAPLSKMPTLNDPKSEGKFPKLGDEDIVGPMVQIASPILQRTPPRKRVFFKFLSDFKFPASFLGLKSPGMRGN
ncbi:hypothetical protein K458DRAFT_285796 [Lentithecium fluviatile CBS 122367]|uniref:Only prolin and serin are matching in the corresponding protein n=1 Tax=Lentithecium fluviatile CBS 122367 TaxID=1168545 RepID=A0A6G1JP17_9PLEO|nr:hypothetical protein K458DRAFT_285796 [Lentithecium fluviatile CBS 122367]